MQLEWFRQHKKFVYRILLPIVGLGMAFFGATRAFETGRFMGNAGPSVSYRAGGKERWLNPTEVVDLRLQLTRYSRGAYASSDDAARHLIAYNLALDTGFEIGSEEKKEALREAVRRQIQMREPGSEAKATPEVYQKLLKSLEMTPAQFERISHERAVAEKFGGYLIGQAKANDSQLFLEFSKQKESARVRFLELKSEDFLAKAAAPTEEKITEFYNKHKDEKQGEMRKMLHSKPRISADVLYLDTSKLLVDLKATDDDLKNFYNRYKDLYWRDVANPADPNAKPGETKYKPFDTVKAEVEQKWKDDQKHTKPNTKMTEIRTQLDKDEKAYNEEQAKKPEAERKPFDLPEWAKKNGLVHWTTKELTEEEFKAGKKELNAPDAAWVENLFMLTREMRNPRIDEINKKRFNEFSFPQPLDPTNAEKGLVIVRKKTFVPETLKKIEECKAAIVDRLKIDDAVELARKDAQKIQAEWVEGRNPDINKLDEITVTSESKHALAGQYYDKPVGVGNVMAVAEGPAEENTPSNPHRRFFIGIPVERKLPTWTTFDKDTAWDRERQRASVAQSDQYFTSMALMRQMKDMGKVVGNLKDPPLFDNARHGPMDDF